MIGFNLKIVVAAFICCIHFGYSQTNEINDCKNDILGYFDTMEKVLSPKGNKVYYMKYNTSTDFQESQNTPSSSSYTEMLIAENKILLDDENMKVFGDDKDVFVVLPKVGKIYWNNSDPRLFAESNSQKKFLEIERALLASAVQINCVVKNGLQHITIIPNDEFEKKSGLKRQLLEYDLNSKRVVRVENLFNTNSRIKKQVVIYEIIDYKSTKKIKQPLEYIFRGTELNVAYKNFEIIDNRKNK